MESLRSADKDSRTCWDLLNIMEPRVKEFTMGLLEKHLRDYLLSVYDSESPIEQLYGIALDEVISQRGLSKEPGILVLDQDEVKCFSKTYRPDFIIYVGNFIYDLGNCLKFAIECDGHDFHEKTKKQATRDKQKDRHLVAAGYHVFRFTGSEIWKDPYKCASETVDMILKVCNDKVS